ncbi:MAG: GntR family transcriptional regulator [Verrucomicrobiota bacterium]
MSSSKSNTKKNRSEDIFNILQSRILSWEYQPGHRLKEDELCREFDVSRIPIREALSRLSQIHLVERKAHVGCSVKRWTLEEINELYEFRVALETYVVEALAQKEDPIAELKELKKEWQGYLTETDDTSFAQKNWSTRDEHFHETLAAALGNQQILNSLQDVNSRLRFLRVQDITTQEVLTKSSKQHISIINAIRRSDDESAKKLMRTNIQMGKGNVKSALQQVLMRSYED